MSISTYFDGVNINTYGVYVSASNGLTSRPKIKQPVTTNWPTYHGEVVNLSKKYYEARDIELDCFIEAAGSADFIAKANTFLALFDAPGTRRLSVIVDGSEPLQYEVYTADEIDIKKTWNPSKMVGTFTLKLKEQEPIKKLLKYTRTGTSDKTVSITVTSSKELNIHWGDGTHMQDVSGTSVTVTHDYSTNGTFYILVTGDIDGITSLTTTGTIVWNKF